MIKQDELFLCASTTDGMEIDDVQALTFHQDGIVFSTIADGSSDEHTWVVKEGDSCMIRTRVHPDFFKPSFRGAKRKSVMVEGTVGLQSDVSVDFEIEISLQSSRLSSHVSGHGLIIAFFILLFLVISVWAAFVTIASITRTGPESLEPEQLFEIEEKRLMDIYSIWIQSQWSKTKSADSSEESATQQTVPVSSSETWSSSSSSEEEKEEIEAHDDESVSSTPSAIAANAA